MFEKLAIHWNHPQSEAAFLIANTKAFRFAREQVAQMKGKGVGKDSTVSLRKPAKLLHI